MIPVREYNASDNPYWTITDTEPTPTFERDIFGGIIYESTKTYNCRQEYYYWVDGYQFDTPKSANEYQCKIDSIQQILELKENHIYVNKNNKNIEKMYKQNNYISMKQRFYNKRKFRIQNL